jgi:RNA polymerase sigma-70 factor (ECF subfamily)
LDRLKAEYESAGNLHRFELLKPAIGEGRQLPVAEAALQLGLTETAARVAAHRLRKRYRDLLREEIAHTVSGPEDIDDELNQLFIALSEPS